MTGHHQGFTVVHPSGLPLARSLPRTERGPLGFFPELRTPTTRSCRRTSERGLISNTDQELRTRHRRPPIREFTRHARLRVAPIRSTSKTRWRTVCRPTMVRRLTLLMARLLRVPYWLGGGDAARSGSEAGRPRRGARAGWPRCRVLRVAAARVPRLGRTGPGTPTAGAANVSVHLGHTRRRSCCG